MNTKQTATACQGTWRQRYVSLPKEAVTDVVVLRCDGCGEQMVVLGYTGYPLLGKYPPDMTPEDCIRLAVQERALQR